MVRPTLPKELSSHVSGIPIPFRVVELSPLAHISNSSPNAVAAVLFLAEAPDLALVVEILGLTADLPVVLSTALISSFGTFLISCSSIRFNRRSSIAM